MIAWTGSHVVWKNRHAAENFIHGFVVIYVLEELLLFHIWKIGMKCVEPKLGFVRHRMHFIAGEISLK